MARFRKRLRRFLPRRFHRTLVGSATLALSLVATIGDIGGGDAVGHHTAVARHDVTAFQDGSTVTLNGTTTLFLEEDAGHRRIFLTEGEIAASVHHSTKKPLEILSNHLAIEDEGTQFDIAVHERSTVVSVTEGQLRVRNRLDDGSYVDPIIVTPSGAKRSPVILNAGDSARFEEQGDVVLGTRRANDLREAQNRTAWLQGQFISFGQRLDEIAWQFEHYTTSQILIEDPEVARMVIGGTYDLSNLDVFLQSLRYYNVEATRIDGLFGGAPIYLLRHVARDTSRGGASSRKSGRPCPCTK